MGNNSKVEEESSQGLCDRWVDRDGWEGRRTTNAVRCYKRPCAETCDLEEKNI